MSKPRLYRIWVAMKTRCYNRNFARYGDYGGRGIKVCEEWKHDFQAFREWALSNGYADDLSIDRVNNDGDYCPENCRWATNLQQSNNSRHCRYIEWRGERHSVSEWARILGVSRHLLTNRLFQYGYSVERAFTEPVGAFSGARGAKRKREEVGDDGR